MTATFQPVDFVHPQNQAWPLLREPERLYCPANGDAFPVVGGIPRLAGEVDQDQSQTRDGFSYKWTRTTDFGSTEAHRQVFLQAYREWFGITTFDDFAVHMQGKCVLNAGCGSGRNEFFWGRFPTRIVDVDISAAIETARSNWGHDPRFTFVQADVLRLPFQDGSFDVVWSEGVLHHTPSTRDALASCVRVLRPGGRILFYIYRKKAPLREFADDHIRGLIADMTPAQAWQALEPLTRFAKAMSDLNVTMTVPEDVDLLGFRAGTYNLQRFLYYNVLKFYWNDQFSFDENVHLNFDWYYPKYCWRHTVAEVRGWLKELGLKEVSLHEADSGIGVIADKVLGTSALRPGSRGLGVGSPGLEAARRRENNPPEGAEMATGGTLGRFSATGRLAAPLWRDRELTWAMTKRDITDRYVGSLLGAFWGVLHPLILLTVYVVIFSKVFKVRMPATFELPLDYTAYIIAGYLPWMALAESLAKSCSAISGQASLVKQVVFPVEVLPIKSILAAVLTQLIGLAFLLGYIVVMHGQVYASWLLLPPLLIMQCVLAGGLALLLSALGAYFRDMKDLMAVFCLANVYLMPIFFLPEWVPAKLKPILLLNPFSHVVWCYQDVCYYGRFEHPWSWLVFPVLSVVCLLAGNAVFRKLEKPMFREVL